MNRREFLRLSSVIPLAGLMPQALLAKQMDVVGKRKIVVLIELQGGNDALNTLIPIKDYSQYKKLRPKLAIPENKLLRLNGDGDGYAMHPSMSPLATYWNNGQMAWIQGVGHSSNNHSHFRSIEIWERGSHDKDSVGWVQQLFSNENEICGIAINERLGPFSGNKSRCLRIGSVDDYVNQAKRFYRNRQQTTQSQTSSASNSLLAHINDTKNEVVRSVQDLDLQMDKVRHIGSELLRDELGLGLQSVAQLIVSGVNVPAYKVGLNGFDTHNQQLGKHAGLLQSLAKNLHIFSQIMKKTGHWDEVIVMTYSEFGRKAKENGGAGTDHGSASSHFVIGGQVKGGMYGTAPSLIELPYGGDLAQTVDFRSVYGSIATNWWDKRNIWNKDTIPFV